MTQFRVILADPPWSYQNRQNGAAANHYGTMTAEEIKALPVATLAHPDSILLLWSTPPLLPQALEVMKAWGYQYKSKIPWFKVLENQDNVPLNSVVPTYGTGYWVRANSEDVLIGVKGDVRAPRSSFLGLVSNRFSHSRKPTSVHDYAESISDGPYLELFARSRRPNWDSWGNEVDSTVELKAE